MHAAYILDHYQPGLRLPISAFGGTFITGGERGRKGFFAPETEDSLDEQEFLNGFDPLRKLNSDEFEALAGGILDSNEDRGLAEIICSANITGETLAIAAKTAIENPGILSLLYEECGTGYSWSNNEVSEMEHKILGTLQQILAAMLGLEGGAPVVLGFLKKVAEQEEDAPTGNNLGLTQVILEAMPTENVVLNLANAALEHPTLILQLYDAGVKLNGVYGAENQKKARAKMFETLQMIIHAMLTLTNTTALEDLFLAWDGNNPPILTTLKRLARNEIRNNGYGHWTAVRMLKSIGHEVTFVVRRPVNIKSLNRR